MDVATLAENYTDRRERRAELDSRDRDYGGSVPSDREREIVEESMIGWDGYRTKLTAADVTEAAENRPDPRAITLYRLVRDCNRGADRWCRTHRPDDRRDLAIDAAALILRWPSHGGNLKPGSDHRSPLLDLGGIRAERLALREHTRQSFPSRSASVLAWIDRAERIGNAGTLPMRRDWTSAATLDESPSRQLPSARAWATIHSALKIVSARPSHERHEVSTEPLNIAAMIETEAAESGEVSRLPDALAADVLAELLGVPLDAARSITARAFPDASHTDLAAQWNVSRSSVAVALSRGAAMIRDRFPDPAELLDALDAAAVTYRELTERAAIVALLDYRDGYVTETDARGAVDEYRGAAAPLSAERLALLAAARNGSRRHGGQYGAERAERVAASIERLVPAELTAHRRRVRRSRSWTAVEVDTTAAAAQYSHHREPITARELSAVSSARGELLALIESGSGNADRIAELRALSASHGR